MDESSASISTSRHSGTTMSSYYDVTLANRQAITGVNRVSLGWGLGGVTQAQQQEQQRMQLQLAAQATGFECAPEPRVLDVCSRLVSFHISSCYENQGVALGRVLPSKESTIRKEFGYVFTPEPKSFGGRSVISAADSFGYVCACCLQKVYLKKNMLLSRVFGIPLEDSETACGDVLLCPRLAREQGVCPQENCFCAQNVNLVSSSTRREKQGEEPNQKKHKK